MKLITYFREITLKKLVAFCLVGYVFGVTLIFVGGYVFDIGGTNNNENSKSTSDEIAQLQKNNSNQDPSNINNKNNTQNPSNSTSTDEQNTQQKPSNNNSTTPTNNESQNNSNTSNGGSPTPSNNTTPSPSPTPTPTPTPNPTPSPTPTPTPTPPPAPACGSPGGACTTSQVAAHNSQGDCWGIYNGGYYILTSYVNKHPGGTSVFNTTSCGKDMTSYLNGSQSVSGQKRKHSSNAYSVLSSYYVGPVK